MFHPATRPTSRTSPLVISLLLVSVLALTSLALSGCGKASGDEYPEVGKEPVIQEPVEPTYWPLTGLEAPSPDAITVRPLSVKIENHAAARPQTGLNQADVVYESIAEGGITRFNCIFQSTIPSRLGPVRSARLSDLWIVPQYSGLFFFSGANTDVLNKVKSSTISNMSHDFASALYKRASDRSAPHNLYLETEGVYDLAKEKGYEVTGVYTGLSFAEIASYATTPTTEITIPISNYVTVNWKWDAAKKVYVRYHYDKPHVDSDGAPVVATNVVVMWAKYTPQSKLNKGSITYDITLGGTGPASLFIGGQRIDGTWSASKDAPPTFTDAAGNAVRLNPGTTWFEVPPLDIKITTK